MTANPDKAYPQQQTPTPQRDAGGPAHPAEAAHPHEAEVPALASQISELDLANETMLAEVGPIENQQPLAIEQLVDDHYAELYRYAYRLAGNTADAADVTQQTFLNAQRNLASLRDAAKARGWLYTILRNTFLKLRRKKNPTTAANLDLEVEQLPDPALAETEASFEFDSEDLQHAIATLPDEFRVVVLMFYFEEISYREIAQALEIPEGTVMSRLSRAKGHLRKRLSHKK